MLRTLFPILCGCVVALVISTGASAAERTPTDAASQSTAPESGARTCYYSCDTWTLYPTLEACTENCPEPCARFCI